jgi:hypothetical protein
MAVDNSAVISSTWFDLTNSFHQTVLGSLLYILLAPTSGRLNQTLSNCQGNPISDTRIFFVYKHGSGSASRIVDADLDLIPWLRQEAKTTKQSVYYLYLCAMHVVIFILFKPSHALFLKHTHIHI